MASLPCHARLAHPDSNCLSAVKLEASADPCPMPRGTPSTHTAAVHNHRGYNVYGVTLSAKSRHKGVTFENGTDEDVWSLQGVLPDGRVASHGFRIEDDRPSGVIADEIETVFILYDSGKWRGGALLPGAQPEQRTLVYTLDII